LKSSEWAKLHPIRWKRMQQKSRAKRRAPCRGCGIKMQFPTKPGQLYCSLKCHLEIIRQREREYRKEIQIRFEKWKKQLGCSICRYNRNGAALQFHHKESREKERRITARSWITRLGKLEIRKCVLLCANCHFEVHHGRVQQ